LFFDDVIEDSPNQIAPHRRDVEAILVLGRSLNAEPSSCAHLLVHCHAGVSRSTAAMTLILAQARPDLSADSILSLEARNCRVVADIGDNFGECHLLLRLSHPLREVPEVALEGDEVRLRNVAHRQVADVLIEAADIGL
jgi:hypothetical protein